MSTNPDIRLAVGVARLRPRYGALSSLPSWEYADACTLRTDVIAAPVTWARVMFGNTPSMSERLIWHVLLRLRLSTSAANDFVAGWHVGAREEDWVRLEAEGPLVAGNLIVRTHHDQVTLATVLHHRRAVSRFQWWWMGPIHRRVLPGLLRGAAERLAAQRRPVR